MMSMLESFPFSLQGMAPSLLLAQSFGVNPFIFVLMVPKHGNLQKQGLLGPKGATMLPSTTFYKKNRNDLKYTTLGQEPVSIIH